MYQSVFPPPRLPSLVVLAAFCVCDFLRTENKQAALIQPSPVSRNLVVHRSKQNLTHSAFSPSKCTFCLILSPFSSFDLTVLFNFYCYLSWAWGTMRYFQPFIFIFPSTIKVVVPSLHRCRDQDTKSKTHDQHVRQSSHVAGAAVCFPCLLKELVMSPR